MTQYTIGAEVTCRGGVCGDLRRMVIDPVARVLTHLVVEPKHREGEGRLVPVDLVDEVAEEISLRCSAAEFDALEHAEEKSFLSPVGAVGMDDMGMSSIPQVIFDDRVPAGEVEVSRGEPVHATDGNIGRVHGLVIDPKDHHVTHVLLGEGHLWGKKEIAIPIGAVKDVTAYGVRLNVTRDEVRDMPPVDLANH